MNSTLVSMPLVRPAGAASYGSPVSPQRSLPAPSQAHAQTPDRVEISPVAQWMDQLESVEPIRRHVVDNVRAEIEAGRYETPDRLGRAIDALAEDLT